MLRRIEWRRSLALALIGSTVLPATAQAEDGVSFDDGGLKARIGDGLVDIRIGGKVHIDAYGVENDGPDLSGADFRRLRPDLRVEIAKTVKLRVEREFARTDQWRNLYAEFEPFDGFRLRGGQFNAPFDMEHLQSANKIPFAERSLAAGLAQDYAVGVQAGYAARRFTVKAAYVGDAINGSGAGEGIAARATWLPVDAGKTKVHLGVAFDLRDFDAGDELRFSARAGTRFADPIFRTETLDALKGKTGVAGEVAVIHRSLAVQAQYLRQWVRRDALPTQKASGGHVQASWMVTGQDHRYSRSGGLPSGPRIRDGSMGVELAARFSWAKADFARDDGADARAVDLSAGLHLNRNFKVMLSGGRAWFGSQRADQRQSQTSGVIRFVAAF